MLEAMRKNKNYIFGVVTVGLFGINGIVICANYKVHYKSGKLLPKSI